MKLWDKLSSIGIDKDMPHFTVRTIKLSNRLAIVISIMLIAYVYPSTLESVWLIPVIIISALLYPVTILLNKVKKHRAAGLYIIFLSLIVNMIMSIIPGPGSGEIYYFIAIGLLPMLLLKKSRIIYGLTLLNALLFLVTFKLQTTIEPLIHTPDNLKLFFLQVNIVIILILVFLCVLYFRTDTDHYERKLEDVNNILAQKNKEITDSIRYAQSLSPARELN
jgi:hypothetical protein